MKKTIFGTICVLFGVHVHAELVHPEDSQIVGAIVPWTSLFDVCFNNDGAVSSISECDGSGVDEGLVWAESATSVWATGAGSAGIMGCGTVAVNPVSDASRSFTASGTFASCTSAEFVLVQTVNSGHFWAIKAAENCESVDPAEATSLIPCRLDDAFDATNGCKPVVPPEITIKDGYIKLDIGNIPPPSHCDDSSHEGRMVVDSVNEQLYICTQAGWKSISVDNPG